MEYIQRIKRLLVTRAITQGDLGERVGLKRAAMSRILSGKQEPKLREAYDLARELGVTLNDLVGEDPAIDSPTGQLVRISQDDLCLLRVAHSLGVDVALARMVNADPPRPPARRPRAGAAVGGRCRISKPRNYSTFEQNCTEQTDMLSP